MGSSTSENVVAQIRNVNSDNLDNLDNHQRASRAERLGRDYYLNEWLVSEAPASALNDLHGPTAARQLSSVES